MRFKYGDDFRDYCDAKKDFFKLEKEKSLWVWLGILAQVVLMLMGMLVLPASYMLLWLAVILVSCVIILSGVVGIWRRTRPYSSFERWLKHREHKRGH